MPELPEVETIKTQLQATLPFVIEAAEYSSVVSSIIKEKNKLFDPSQMTIDQIERHGKMLIFHLMDLQGKEFFILSHLGMSGSWRISNGPLQGVKHIHVVFHGPGKTLSYVDPRRFGHMYFLDKERAKKQILKLGVDIGSEQFQREYIWQVFKKFPEKIIKPFLLDQKYFAGSGNYIASEICARAGIRPTRKCKNITKNECQKIIQATQEVLDQNITGGGAAFSGGYSDTRGDKGEGVTNLVVFYQKICQMCKKNAVKKIIIAGRGTYYCPHCQK